MNKLKIIITGATGMVGEGVLLHCLQSDEVEEVLLINRKHFDVQHAKLKEIILPDFNNLQSIGDQLQGYDACFFCAGVSSVGMNEADYTRITYDTTLNFAKALYAINPSMVFTYVSGAQTNIEGKLMWQKVKGRTEADLTKLGFRGQYNFRPGAMKPVAGQKNVRWFFRLLIPVFSLLSPKNTLSLNHVGQAMINAVNKGYGKSVLEISDIKKIAVGQNKYQVN